MILWYPLYDFVDTYKPYFTERLSDFPKVTQLASGGTGIQTKFLTTYYYIKCSIVCH